MDTGTTIVRSRISNRRAVRQTVFIKALHCTLNVWRWCLWCDCCCCWLWGYRFFFLWPKLLFRVPLLFCPNHFPCSSGRGLLANFTLIKYPKVGRAVDKAPSLLSRALVIISSIASVSYFFEFLQLSRMITSGTKPKTGTKSPSQFLAHRGYPQ